jgi:NADH:ubiquinone oxidoreductase subunit K
MIRLAILLLPTLPLPAQLNVVTVAGGKLRTGVPAQDVALYVCALNAKEMAVSLPVLLAAYETI